MKPAFIDNNTPAPITDQHRKIWARAYNDMIDVNDEAAAKVIADAFAVKDAEIARLTKQLTAEANQAFTGKIEAIDKAGIDPMGCHPVLRAVQDGDISTGKARELLRCWALGTFTPDMLPPAQASGLSDDDFPGEVIRTLRAQLATAAGTSVKELEKYKNRMEWLHDCSTGCVDAEGFEWGIYRVKWVNGKPIEVWQTNSDFSDLDRAMAAEAAPEKMT